MRKLILFYIILMMIITRTSAGTLMDGYVKWHHPFLSENGGFDSLFMNPAGMAGQTEIITFAVETGAWGDLNLINEYTEIARKMSALTRPNKSITKEEVKEIIPWIADDVSQSTLDAILKDSSLEGKSLDDIVNDPTVLDDWSSKDPETVKDDLKIIQDNMSDEGLQQTIKNEFRSMSFKWEGSVRLGTLISGFGFSLYSNVYSNFSVGALGIDDAIMELGGLMGYGFQLDRFNFGIRGQYAMFVTNDPEKSIRLDNEFFNAQGMLYGNAWNVDIGTIWEPLDGLRLGLLLTDLIGNKTKVDDMVTVSFNNAFGFDKPNPGGGYNFNLDLSMGASWERPYGIFRPRIGFDFYDIFGMIRSINGDFTGVEQFYNKNTPILNRHLRVGGNMKFFNVIDLGVHWFMERYALGLGFDLIILELYGEVNASKDFTDMGVDFLVKITY